MPLQTCTQRSKPFEKARTQLDSQLSREQALAVRENLLFQLEQTGWGVVESINKGSHHGLVSDSA